VISEEVGIEEAILAATWKIENGALSLYDPKYSGEKRVSI